MLTLSSFEVVISSFESDVPQGLRTTELEDNRLYSLGKITGLIFVNCNLNIFKIMRYNNYELFLF